MHILFSQDRIVVFLSCIPGLGQISELRKEQAARHTCSALWLNVLCGITHGSVPGDALFGASEKFLIRFSLGHRCHYITTYQNQLHCWSRQLALGLGAVGKWKPSVENKCKALQRLFSAMPCDRPVVLRVQYRKKPHVSTVVN